MNRKDYKKNYVFAIKPRLNWFVLVLIIVGGLIACYPAISNFVNYLSSSRAVVNYEQKTSTMSTEEKNAILAEAHRYNEHLFDTSTNQNIMTQYWDILNLDGNGMMADLRISKLSLNLPVYHGTEHEVLNHAIGHVEGSSLPVGGVNTHAILSGHRGLSSAELFSRLNEMAVGDIFSIKVLDDTLYYKVECINVCSPDDKTYLQIEKGRDLVTLLTCTPYGINTERLLVRGYRIDNPYGDLAELNNDVFIISPVWLILALFAVTGVCGFIALFVCNRRQYRANRGDLEVLIDNKHDSLEDVRATLFCHYAMQDDPEFQRIQSRG